MPQRDTSKQGVHKVSKLVKSKLYGSGYQARFVDSCLHYDIITCFALLHFSPLLQPLSSVTFETVYKKFSNFELLNFF